MDIFLHDATQKFLDKLDKKSTENIKSRLKELSENPYSSHLDIKKLKGLKNRQDLFRLRIGDFRVIYFMQENSIWITEISRREGAYDF